MQFRIGATVAPSLAANERRDIAPIRQNRDDIACQAMNAEKCGAIRRAAQPSQTRRDPHTKQRGVEHLSKMIGRDATKSHELCPGPKGARQTVCPLDGAAQRA